MRTEIITKMEINLDNLVHNFHAVSQHVAPARVAAVVKSEAYGHGAVPVAQVLEANGCDLFAVAMVDEGIQLRNAGIKSEIIILGATLPAQFKTMVKYWLTPVLADLDRAQGWNRVAEEIGKNLSYHLKVDVGLGRMGLLPSQGEEAVSCIQGLTNAKLEGISSHLSYPGGPVEQNEAERDKFLQFCKPFDDRSIQFSRHLAASQAVARFEDMHYDMVRVGGLLYGFQHVDPSPIDLKFVMKFTTQVAQVKMLPAGWGVGYNNKHILEQSTKVALLPLGWTDGLTSYMVDKAKMLVNGHYATLIGVCTDFAMLDVSHIPEVKMGDEVVLIGQQGSKSITPIELGESGGFSTGQLLGKTSIRVPRLYYKDGKCQEELSILNYR